MNLTGYKTYIFGLAVTILGVLQTDPNFTAMLGTHAGLVTSLIGVGILVLRSLTTTPPLQPTPTTSSVANPAAIQALTMQ